MLDNNQPIELTVQDMLKLYESAWDDQLQIIAFQASIKQYRDSISTKLKEFAKSSGIDKKLIDKAWARYQDLKAKRIDVTDKTYYSLISAVDEFFLNEKN